MSDESKAAGGRERVVLKKKHRHGGKDYEAGAEITVTPLQKEWLKRNGVI